MKKQFGFFLAYIFSLGIIISFFSCKKSQEKVVQLPEPQIVAGITSIHGKLSDPKSQLTSLILRFQNPVTASETIIETQVEKDGSFYIETQIECSPVFCSIYNPKHGSVLIELFSNEDKKINLVLLGSSGKLVLDNFSGNTILTNRDMVNCGIVLDKYEDSFREEWYIICNMTPNEYVNYLMEVIFPARSDCAMKDVKFSDAGKKFVLNELKLIQVGTLLEYKEYLEMKCRDKETIQFQEPDIQYYTFLKSFYLNNPQYINNCCNPFFNGMIKGLLTRKAFNIPLIADMPVAEWIDIVKSVLSELVGFDSGQFYDLLAAHSYSNQFKDELIPLSDIQINNIKEYFGDGEIGKILLRKNEEIIKLKF